MSNADNRIYLKIPEYCLKRHINRLEKSGEIEINIKGEDIWESPKITPNFGDENNNIISNKIVNRIPRIYSIDNDDIKLQAEDKIENLKYLLEYKNKRDIPSESKIDICNNVYNNNLENEFEENNLSDSYLYNDNLYDENDNLTPLVYSAARYRLYDIEWEEKLNFNKGSLNDEFIDNKNMNYIVKDNKLLDSIGIKGPKIFETYQGKIIILKNGDFGFEFLNRKKLFIIKGGGCFISINDINDDDIYDNIDNIENMNNINYHINELPNNHLKRYFYGMELCETIKSFIPRVKLRVLNEGIYYLMSNRSNFSNFQANFELDELNISIIHLYNEEKKIKFVLKCNKIIEFDRFILDQMGNYENIDITFNDPENNEYLIKKTHEISEYGINWSIIIKFWRLILNRLFDCKNIELQGLKKYSELISNNKYNFNEENHFNNNENHLRDWKIRKELFDKIFPIEIEKKLS